MINKQSGKNLLDIYISKLIDKQGDTFCLLHLKCKQRGSFLKHARLVGNLKYHKGVVFSTLMYGELSHLYL